MHLMLPMEEAMLRLLAVLLLVLFLGVAAEAQEVPGAASVNGKYDVLIQTLTCPQDAGVYGQFRDYGYWPGGPWCGQTGLAGYWVWVNPTWYVWKSTGAPGDLSNPPDRATVGGKYSDLIQVMECEQDTRQYGEFRDYGYWGGGPWCGQTGQAGYWVWVYPNWYVWLHKQGD